MNDLSQAFKPQIPDCYKTLEKACAQFADSMQDRFETVFGLTPRTRPRGLRDTQVGVRYVAYPDQRKIFIGFRLPDNALDNVDLQIHPLTGEYKGKYAAYLTARKAFQRDMQPVHTIEIDPANPVTGLEQALLYYTSLVIQPLSEKDQHFMLTGAAPSAPVRRQPANLQEAMEADSHRLRAALEDAGIDMKGKVQEHQIWFRPLHRGGFRLAYIREHGIATIPGVELAKLRVFMDEGNPHIRLTRFESYARDGKTPLFKKEQFPLTPENFIKAYASFFTELRKYLPPEQRAVFTETFNSRQESDSATHPKAAAAYIEATLRFFNNPDMNQIPDPLATIKNLTGPGPAAA